MNQMIREYINRCREPLSRITPIKYIFVSYLRARYGKAKMLRLFLEWYVQKHYLPAPDQDLNNDKRVQFDRIYEETLLKGIGRTIRYNCQYPKHEFLSYLAASKDLLLHGSNELDLEVLLPDRKSGDERYYGSLNAVYACADGIWPIFYAVANRRLTPGWVSTDCYQIGSDIHTGKWAGKKIYHFSLGAQLLERNPWVDGMVYLLPKGSFKRLSDPTGFPLEEWVSEEAVQPVAQLPVSPADFSFLDRVATFRRRVGYASTPSIRDPGLHEDYSGQYMVEGEYPVTVVAQNGNLFIQPPGFPAVEMQYEAIDKYSIGLARAVFRRNSKFDVAKLTLHFFGNRVTAERVQ
jgi:hypothetical protein